ncbi:helix-turn-helix domain-containing protein [Streptococcus suis]
MANSLKTLRRFRNMTQEKLSAETGITARTIQNYESDISNLRKASYENLVALAKALNVSIDDIFLDDISEFLKLPKPN